MENSGTTPEQPRLAVVIPAKDEAERIAATVRASKALPYVDLIVVVDDGSQDRTQDRARQAGAVTVRHTANRGKASSMETGAKVVGMRDETGRPPRLLLFLDADLGDSAAQALPLIEPVVNGEADCTVAVFPKQAKAGGHGFVLNLSRKAIRRATGWNPQAPLCGQRCITREAFESVMPLATGWGVETDMTIKLLTNGYAMKETPCQMTHRVTRSDLHSQLHRLRQYLDVQRAVANLRMHGIWLPRSKYRDVARNQRPGTVYQIPGVRRARH